MSFCKQHNINLLVRTKKKFQFKYSFYLCFLLDVIKVVSDGVTLAFNLVSLICDMLMVLFVKVGLVEFFFYSLVTEVDLVELCAFLVELVVSFGFALVVVSVLLGQN